jgi:outer membrane protein assembly factor BamB
MRAVCLGGALAILAVMSAAGGAAESPVGWRQDTTGVFPSSSPPRAWSAEEHVVWKAPLPGSNGCPLVVGDRVFVGAEPARLVCLDAADGQVLWEAKHDYEEVLDAETLSQVRRNLEQADTMRRDELAPLEQKLGDTERALQVDEDDEALRKQVEDLRAEIEATRARLEPLEEYRVPERSAGNTTATPATDGQHVYVVCGTGVVGCYDLAGERQWIRLVDRTQLDWGHTASPVLVGGMLIVHLQDLVALDAATGEERWRRELRPSYGSPAFCRIGDEDALVTAAGDLVRVRDGELLAQELSEPLGQCSPVVQDGVAYFIQRTSRAVRLPQSEGDEPETLWEATLFEDNYYASPLVLDGRVYAVSEQRVLTVLDAASGEELYEQRLRFKARGAVVSSLAAAGGLIYVLQESGNAKLLRPGRKYAEVGENPLEGLRSSPTFAGNRLYLRTHEHVYCIAAE